MLTTQANGATESPPTGQPARKTESPEEASPRPRTTPAELPAKRAEPPEEMRPRLRATRRGRRGRLHRPSNPANGKGMLALFYIAAFVASFNEIIINVAIVDVMQSFSIDSVTAQWLVTGYMIVTVVIVAAIAYLSRRFTLRMLFFSGAGCFIAGSIAAMAAQSYAVLLASRLVQAVGSGIFIPTMMNVVMAVAPREKLGTYFSVGSSCIVLGPAFGPVIAGIMVTMGGWRAIFAPGCIVFGLLVAVGVFVVRNVGESERPHLDGFSIASMAAGLVCVSYGLTQVTYNLVVAIAALAVGGALIALFARRQNRLDEPLLNVRPLARPGFSLACCLVVIAMMTTFSLSVLLPLYFETALGLSAFAAGLLMLIPVLVNALTALVGGRILDRFGTWPLLPAGFALIVVGLALLAIASTTGQLVPVVAAATLAYAGVGPVFAPSQTAGLRTLAPEENPHGVALVNVAIQLAGCVGPSLFVGIFSSGGFTPAIIVACALAFTGCCIAFYYARKAY